MVKKDSFLRMPHTIIHGVRAIFIAVFMIVTGCEKELSINYKDIDPILVIEGSLDQNGAKVRLTMTTPMDEPMDKEPVTDASVSITDATTGETNILELDSEGNFNGRAAGIPGHSYSLCVERGGVDHISTCYYPELLEIIQLEFSWIRMPYDHVAVLQVTFSDNTGSTGDCYWVRLYRNGEAYMWNLVTDAYASAGVINDVFMTSRKDLDEEDEATALRKGDVVKASVTPISREMYDYLEAVSSDSNGPQMFAGGFCLGYFLAAPVAVSEIVFDI